MRFQAKRKEENVKQKLGGFTWFIGGGGNYPS